VAVSGRIPRLPPAMAERRAGKGWDVRPSPSSPGVRSHLCGAHDTVMAKICNTPPLVEAGKVMLLSILPACSGAEV